MTQPDEKNNQWYDPEYKIPEGTVFESVYLHAQPDETCPKCGAAFKADSKSQLGGQHFTCGTIVATNGNLRYISHECAAAELASLKAQLAEATETYTAPDGEVWSPPTAEAYYRACEALRERGRKLAEAEKERDEIRQWKASRVKCPIGLDDKPQFCSAGSCETCIGNRIEGLGSELTAATSRAERAERILERMTSGVAALQRQAATHSFPGIDTQYVAQELAALLAQPAEGSDGK